MKKITLNVDNITTKQWTNFVLELNIMKKAWRPYGVDVKFVGHGINKIIDWGNRSYDSTKNPIYCDFWYKTVKERYGRNSKLLDSLSSRHERNKFTIPEAARANDFIRLHRLFK